eukprot:UN12416
MLGQTTYIVKRRGILRTKFRSKPTKMTRDFLHVVIFLGGYEVTMISLVICDLLFFFC